MGSTTGNNNLQALGKFFHEYRVGRGLTLNEVSGEWSAATLSRFERGELDISTDKVLGLMARLGIDELDFISYYITDWSNLPLDLQEIIQLNDVPKLRKREQEYFANQPQTTNVTELVAILFRAGKFWPRARCRLTDEEEQRLADYLNDPGQFGLIEAEFFKAIVGPASHELLVLLAQRARQVSQNWSGAREMQLLMIWLGALMDRDMDLADAIAPELTSSFKVPRVKAALTEFLPNWQFGQAVYRWLHVPTADNSQRVVKMIQALRDLGVETDAHWFELMFNRVQVGKVYHNQHLVDHGVHIQHGDTAAAVVHNRRLQLHLSIREVARASSTSAIRRFESGQTRLSFGSLVRLTGELGLLASQVLATPVPACDGSPALLTLRTTFKRVNGLDRAQALPIIEQFLQQQPYMPQKTERAERLILLAATKQGLVDDAETQQEATELAKGMLQMNLWGSLETHATIPLATILPPAQLSLLFKKGWRVLARHPYTVGANYYFWGMSDAIRRIVRNFDAEAAKNFLRTFDWLPKIADPTPMRWQSVGMWYAARYVLEPTQEHYQQLELFVHQTVLTGHTDTLASLKTEWADKLPAGTFDDAAVEEHDHA